MLDPRAVLLRVTLGFLSMPPHERELRLLHRYADTWRGIGDVVAGMARREYDLELRRYNGRGWRAIFFQSGFEHSLTSHAGSAWARSPWEAVQRALLGHSRGDVADGYGLGFPVGVLAEELAKVRY